MNPAEGSWVQSPHLPLLHSALSPLPLSYVPDLRFLKGSCHVPHKPLLLQLNILSSFNHFSSGVCSLLATPTDGLQKLSTIFQASPVQSKLPVSPPPLLRTVSCHFSSLESNSHVSNEASSSCCLTHFSLINMNNLHMCLVCFVPLQNLHPQEPWETSVIWTQKEMHEADPTFNYTLKCVGKCETYPTC